MPLQSQNENWKISSFRKVADDIMPETVKQGSCGNAPPQVGPIDQLSVTLAGSKQVDSHSTCLGTASKFWLEAPCMTR